MKAFYRINNILILGILLYLGFLYVQAHNFHQNNLLSQYFSDAKAVESNPGNPTNVRTGENCNDPKNKDSRICLIFKNVPVTFSTAGSDGNFSVNNPLSFTAKFQSDGLSGNAIDNNNPTRYADFAQSKVSPIDIPLKFTIDNTKSTVELPGELVFSSMPTATAPKNIKCKDNQNDSNCMTNVTAASSFAALNRTNLVFKATPQIQAQISQATNGGFIESIRTFLKNTLNIDLPLSNTPNLQVCAFGTNSYWGDDEINQFVKIDNEAIKKIQICVKETGVIRSIDYQNAGLSTDLKAGQTQVYASALKEVINKAGISVLGDAYAQPIETVTNPTEQNQSIIGSLINSFFKLLPAFTPGQEEIKNKKISPHVSLRPVEESDIFNAGYKLCDAAKGYPELANPFEPAKSEEDKYYSSRYNLLNSSAKSCLGALNKYLLGKDPEERVKSCARQAIDTGGCDDFTVEEKDLHMELMVKTLPIGLGAYFQNTTLNNLTPNPEGPYLNYLSPMYCTRLNLVYRVDKGASYIYKWGGGTSGTDHTINNGYCVVGALLSNFHWVLTQMQNYYGTDVFNQIRLPREGLTCDKKEQVISGADVIYSNIKAPQNKLIYINSDAYRGELKSDYEDVAVNHGYDLYSLSDVYNEVKRPINLYASQDIRVVVGDRSEPKYVVFSTSTPVDKSLSTGELLEQKAGAPDDEEPAKAKSLVICNLQNNNSFLNKPGQAQQRHCKVLSTSSNDIQVPMPAYTKVDGQEYITLVNYFPIGGGVNKVSFFVVKINQSNIEQSTISDIFDLSGGGKYAFEVQQLAMDGPVAVMISGFNDPIMQVALIDPVKSGNNMIAARKGNDQFCEFGALKTICGYIYKNFGNAKLVYDPTTGKLFSMMIGNGLGVVYELKLSDSDNRSYDITVTTPYLFSINTNANNGLSGIPMVKNRIASAKYDPYRNGFHVFLNDSGAYLRLVLPESVGENNYSLELKRQCEPFDCLVNLQSQFNPKLFTTDYTDYYGNGVVAPGGAAPSTDYLKVAKLSAPNVIEFTVGTSGQTQPHIFAWYLYNKSLKKTVLYSDDLLYSYSGYYTSLGGNTYSNAYLPKLNGERLEANPVAFRNYFNGGLRKNIELNEVNGIITESDDVLRPDKARCKATLAKVIDEDPYFDINNIQKGSLASAPPLTRTNSGSNGSVGSINSGEFCEESWCIQDKKNGGEDIFGNFEKFGNDGSNTKLKNIITDYLVTNIRKAPTGTPIYDRAFGEYYPKVDTMCNKSAQYGMPCELLAGVWIQETSGRTREVPNDPPLGCGIGKDKNGIPVGETLYGPDWYTFSKQVDCAIGSFKTSNGMYDQDQMPGAGVGSINNQAGNCRPATRFSMLLERYTPIDKRRNQNNQCNAGVVNRSDRNLKCGNNSASPINSNDWPNGEIIPYNGVYGSRKNIYVTVDALNKLLGNRLPTTTACYPATNSSNNQPGIPSQNLESYLKDNYGSSYKVYGDVQLDLKEWGKSSAAGSFFMALHGFNSDYKQSLDATPPSQRKGVGGLVVLKPGEKFDFNNILNPADGRRYDEAYRDAAPKYAATGGFNMFDGRCKDSEGRPLVGCGWCELATGFAKAARKVDRLKWSYSTTPGGVSSVGDIAYPKHNDVTIDVFNRLAERPEDRMTDIREYVVIDTEAGASLAITNQKKDDGSDGDLIIYTIHNQSTGIVTFQFAFAQAKGSSSTPTPSQSSRNFSPINYTAVVDLNKKRNLI